MAGPPHTYGRIWRLDDQKAAASPERIETKRLLAANFTNSKDEELGEILKNPDMRVRMKAQFELAKRGKDGAAIFQKMISQRANQLARINAVWGMSQLARQDKKWARPLLPLLKDADPEIRAQAAKWLGDMRWAEAGASLLPLLKDTASRARFFAAEALGRIKYAPAVGAIIDMLQANDDRDVYLRHAGSLALARIGNAGPVVALATSSSRALRIAAVVALRRMGNPGVAKFLDDADEFVVTEAARAINDDLSIPGALPALGNLLGTTPYSNEALIRRAISANSRVGTDAAMQNLVQYAQNEKVPEKMRAEAIDALSVWARPSVLDRVDGRLRGPVTRDSAALKSKLTVPLLGLLKSSTLPVRLSAAKAAALLHVEQAAPTLLAQVKSDPSPEMRIASLTSLVDLNDRQVGQAVSQALSDKERKVRVEGLRLLQKTTISKDLMASLLSDVIATKTMEEKQAAILTLGRLPIEQSKKPLQSLLDKMAGGQLSPDLQLELGEAADSSHSNELIARYKSVSQKLSPNELMASYSSCLLGGDSSRGKNIFFRNQNTQCMRCHSYDDRGGNAGPRLNGIAGRISRQQILEALITPSARLSPGYGMVTLNLKGGKTLFGILEKESKSDVRVKIGDQPEQVIPKDQIAKRTDAPSSMPVMTELLTKREIRDVVSFLSTLKENN